MKTNLQMKETNIYESPAVSHPQGIESIPKAKLEDFNTESFLKEIIKKKLRGEKILELAKIYSIDLSYSMIRTKLKAYKKDGIKGIVRQTRTDANKVRSFSNEVIQRMMETYTLTQNILHTYNSTHKWLRENSSRFIHDSAEYEILNGNLYECDKKTISIISALYTDGMYITQDGQEMQIGSYRSAARYLSEIKTANADQLHFAKYGLHSYRLKRQRSIRLNYSKLMPNDLWSGDNKRLDIMVIDWDWKSVFVPWLSGLYDLATRRYCYELTRSADSKSVSNALCKAIKAWGLPKEVNTDNGPDYVSHKINNLLQSLNVKQRSSIAYNAKAKPIESFHNIIDQKTKVLPGYIGNRYDVMPEDTKIMMKDFLKVTNLHKLYDKNICDEEIRFTLNSNLEGRIKKSKKRFLHISEFIDFFNSILSEYESTVQGGLEKDMLGKKAYDRLCNDSIINELGEKINTPAGRYEYKCKLGFIPTYIQEDILALFAMNQTMRTVQLRGIQFRDSHYFSSNLKSVIGKKVLIKYLDTDQSFIYVFSSDYLQKIQSDTILNKLDQSEVNKELKFLCVADREKIFDYGDTGFKDQVKEQRSEEKQIKESLGITKMTGFETEIDDIKKAELELVNKKSNHLKLKSNFDD